MKPLLHAALASIFLLAAVSRAQVNTERFRQDADSLGFSVSSDLDLTVMLGNADFMMAGTSTRFNINRETAYAFLVIEGGLGREKGNSFFNQALAHFRNVTTLSPALQLEEFVQYDFNKKRLLLSRMLAGAGLRFKVFKNKVVKIRNGLSCFFEYEQYTLEENNRHEVDASALRLSTYLTTEVSVRKDVRYIGVTYFQPDMQYGKDFRILSDHALEIHLGKHAALMVKATYRYDSRPPDGIKAFDFITKSGVALDF